MIHKDSINNHMVIDVNLFFWALLYDTVKEYKLEGPNILAHQNLSKTSKYFDLKEQTYKVRLINVSLCLF